MFRLVLAQSVRSGQKVQFCRYIQFFSLPLLLLLYPDGICLFRLASQGVFVENSVHPSQWFLNARPLMKRLKTSGEPSQNTATPCGLKLCRRRILPISDRCQSGAGPHSDTGKTLTRAPFLPPPPPVATSQLHPFALWSQHITRLAFSGD